MISKQLAVDIANKVNLFSLDDVGWVDFRNIWK